MTVAIKARQQHLSRDADIEESRLEPHDKRQGREQHRREIFPITRRRMLAVTSVRRIARMETVIAEYFSVQKPASQ